MNKMKQLIFVVIGFIIAALVIGLLFGSVKSDIAQQVEENKRESSIAAVSESVQREQEIVLFTTYQYAGATKISSGCFINKNGKRFVFDCDKEEISDPTKLFEKFSAKLDEIDGKEDNLITIVGYLPFVVEGDELKIVGRFVEHKEYGRQFKVDTFEILMPKTSAQLEKYLKIQK